MPAPTTNHEEIRRWAKFRDATPAEIHPRKFDGEPAILRFLMHGAAGTPEIRPLSWESFFATFDLLGLAFAYDGDDVYELLQIEGKSAYRFEGKPV